MQTTRRLTIPILTILLLTGCALKNGRTPEGLAADYGVRIARTVGAAQEAIGSVGKTSTVPAVKTGAVAALQSLQHVNTLGVTLAGKLDAIRIARGAGQEPSGLVSEAVALIDQIDAAVSLGVLPKIGDLPETKAALEAARAISKLILEIQFHLGRQS
jgi:hypothetical protein